jgi:hypothetical protein
LAALMLVLFAFSVTPKLILHDLVANHKDTPLKCSTDNKAQFNVAGFNCGCNDLVVESPLVRTHVAAEIIAPQIFSQHIDTEVRSFISVYQFYFELRGPPSLT